MKRIPLTLLLAALLLGPLACAEETDVDMPADTTLAGQPAGDALAGQATVGVYQQEPYGSYLVDAQDRSLYLFMADAQGEASACYDACADAWPPFLSEGEPVADDPAVQAGLLGTIERTDGTTQVTYNGWPLYYFAQDQQPGDLQGQDVEGFGAEWYLVSPDGNHVAETGGMEEGS